MEDLSGQDATSEDVNMEAGTWGLSDELPASGDPSEHKETYDIDEEMAPVPPTSSIEVPLINQYPATRLRSSQCKFLSCIYSDNIFPHRTGSIRDKNSTHFIPLSHRFVWGTTTLHFLFPHRTGLLGEEYLDTFFFPCQTGPLGE